MDASERALNKFEKNIEAGAYYEAQQQILTVYRRFMAKNDLNEGHHLIDEAVPQLLKAKQEQLAAELAQTVFQDLLPVRNMDWGDCANSIAALLMSHFDDYDVSVDTYLSLANLAIKIRIAYLDDEEQINQAYLGAGVHVMKARGLEGFSLASNYLARGYIPYNGSPYHYGVVKFAKELSEGQNIDTCPEVDYLIMRSALKVLLLNVRGLEFPEDEENLARALYSACEKELSRPPCPISNCFSLLLKGLEDRNKEIFDLARREYKATLEADPGIAADLDKIAAKAFGSRSPNLGGMGGLLEGLLGSSRSLTA